VPIVGGAAIEELETFSMQDANYKTNSQLVISWCKQKGRSDLDLGVDKRGQHVLGWLSLAVYAS